MMCGFGCCTVCVEVIAMFWISDMVESVVPESSGEAREA